MLGQCVEDPHTHFHNLWKTRFLDQKCSKPNSSSLKLLETSSPTKWEPAQLCGWLPIRDLTSSLYLLGVAHRRTRPATVRLPVGVASLANSGRTGGVVAKIKTVVNCRQIDARTGMHLVITVGLRVAVDEILSHFYSPRSLFDWASTEAARVLVVALYLLLSRT